MGTYSLAGRHKRSHPAIVIRAFDRLCIGFLVAVRAAATNVWSLSTARLTSTIAQRHWQLSMPSQAELRNRHRVDQVIDKLTRDAAVADAWLATSEFDDARAWLHARPELTDPLAAEIWVLDPTYSHVLLVQHRVRGLVAPGGTVERRETPRAAAVRELLEETGVVGDLLSAPAAVGVRSYRADWAPTLSLFYSAVVDRAVPLGGESGQPPRWVSLDDRWDSMFPEDRGRIRAHARRLATEAAVAAR